MSVFPKYKIQSIASLFIAILILFMITAPSSVNAFQNCDVSPNLLAQPTRDADLLELINIYLHQNKFDSNPIFA